MPKIPLAVQRIYYEIDFRWKMLYLKYFRWRTYAEFMIPSFFDPIPKGKKKETNEEYLDRLPIKQALRYTKFMTKSAWLTDFRVRYADWSGRGEDEMKEVIKLKNAAYESYLHSLEYYKRAIQRYHREKYRK